MCATALGATLPSVLEARFFHRHLDEEESIKMIVHQHWVLGARELVWPTLVFFGSWILLVYIPDRLVFFGVALVSMSSVVWFIRNFFDYYLDAWIITNKGVIDLEWHGWFHRESARILYSDIEGVSYEIKGVVQTLLNIGDMTVEKVSTGGSVTMPFVKNPRAIEMLILECLEAYLLKKNMKDAKTVQNILAEFVAGTIHSDKIKNSKK